MNICAFWFDHTFDHRIQCECISADGVLCDFNRIVLSTLLVFRLAVRFDKHQHLSTFAVSLVMIWVLKTNIPELCKCLLRGSIRFSNGKTKIHRFFCWFTFFFWCENCETHETRFGWVALIHFTSKGNCTEFGWSQRNVCSTRRWIINADTDTSCFDRRKTQTFWMICQSIGCQRGIDCSMSSSLPSSLYVLAAIARQSVSIPRIDALVMTVNRLQWLEQHNGFFLLDIAVARLPFPISC